MEDGEGMGACLCTLHRLVNMMLFMSQHDATHYEKHAYSNILKILPPNHENFQIKILIFLIFLLQT